MEAPPSLVRLALGGFLLDPRVYRAQRDDVAGLRRGLLLVLLIGLMGGVAAFIGDLGEYFTQPSPQLVAETIYNGLVAMPWFEAASQTNPELGLLLEQTLIGPGAVSFTPSPLTSALGILIAPVAGLISWLVSGAFAHIAARAFGGTARFAQTMAATALASSAGLLGLVQAVPYAELFPGSLLVASSVLGLIATYVAVRETHGIAPWRSFWAVVIGPLLLSMLLVSLYCCFIFAIAGAAGSLGSMR